VLRQAQDVSTVGEKSAMPETAAIAAGPPPSGHLVLATLHAPMARGQTVPEHDKFWEWSHLISPPAWNFGYRRSVL